MKEDIIIHRPQSEILSFSVRNSLKKSGGFSPGFSHENLSQLPLLHPPFCLDLIQQGSQAILIKHALLNAPTTRAQKK